MGSWIRFAFYVLVCGSVIAVVGDAMNFPLFINVTVAFLLGHVFRGMFGALA